MHLWPSLQIRDSFKHSYLDNMERNLRRMKQQQGCPSSSDPLLANRDNVGSSFPEDLHEQEEPLCLYSKVCRTLAFCSDLVLVLSCCCCCFCCGACDDEKDSLTAY
ncbi:hypothetical protein Cni_G12977 [Canna indica]|uniref:Uncharacterized protein n=1 Tax=Canna indica TaxID=4628 RepID=A0AAQ3KEE7_9LILI|nr:hypothetical protein Cni_G12977 [Canna indica]